MPLKISVSISVIPAFKSDLLVRDYKYKGRAIAQVTAREQELWEYIALGECSAVCGVCI